MCQISSGWALNALVSERDRVRAQAIAASITKARGAVLVAGSSERARRMQRSRANSMAKQRMDAPEMTQAHQTALDTGIG